MLDSVRKLLSPPPPPPPPLAEAAAVPASLPRDRTGVAGAGRLTEAGQSDAAGLPWDRIGEAVTGGADKPKGLFGKILSQVKDIAAKLGVEQYWPNSCVGAVAQALWQRSDPEGYGAAADELAETGTLTLPSGDAVTLDPATIKAIDEKAGGDEQLRKKMLMQAALMEHATEGQWCPQADEREIFTGVDQAGIARLSEAIGVDMINLDAAELQAAGNKAKGGSDSKRDVVEDVLTRTFEENPEAHVGLTIRGPNGNHEVIVTQTEDGTYKVANPDGSPVALPEGHPNPMSMEELRALIPKNDDDVGNRGGRPGTHTGGKTEIG